MMTARMSKNISKKLKRMAKIEFDIKYRPQIESGEYKVETEDGREVKIISFDVPDANDCPIAGLFRLCAGTPTVGLFDKHGSYKGEGKSDYNLVIITPAPELTEFEKKLVKLVELSFATCTSKNDLEECVRKHSAELFELAKDEVYSSDSLIEYANKAREEGRNEALKDLPIWKKCEIDTGQTILYKGFCKAQNYLEVDGYRIMLSDLEKLPKEK